MVTASRIQHRLPVIGVTGPIGSGKSSVADCLRRWGAIVLSGDAVGHDVVDRSALLRRRLARVFGPEILAGGGINRSRLAQRAFRSRMTVQALNRIVHPALVAELNRRARAAHRNRRARAVVIDAALLVEWGIGRVHWDILIGVNAPYQMRRSRLRKRGVSGAAMRRISRAQMPWKQKQSYCDFVINNDSSLAILRERLRPHWDRIVKGWKAKQKG